MTSPLPIIVDSEDRGMKRPVEEVARAIDEAGIAWLNGCYAKGQFNMGWADVPDDIMALAVLDRLVQLGFLNDNYFVAKKAEEAGDEERTNT